MYMYFMKWTPPTQLLDRAALSLSHPLFLATLLTTDSQYKHHRLQWSPTARHGGGTCRDTGTKWPQGKTSLTLAQNGCTWWCAGTYSLNKRSNLLVKHVHHHSYYSTTIRAIGGHKKAFMSCELVLLSTSPAKNRHTMNLWEE